jgi:hypothetical protein
MAITITVEDGTQVADANSFMSVDDARAYAFDRGVTLSSQDDKVASQILNAMDYLATYRAKWKGIRVAETQALAWPRSQVWIEDHYFAEDEIPLELIHALGQLVMAVHGGFTLLPNTVAGLPIIREKIGPIETVWAAPSDMASIGWTTNDFPTVVALLAPLINEGFGLRTLRI